MPKLQTGPPMSDTNTSSRITSIVIIKRLRQGARFGLRLSVLLFVVLLIVVAAPGLIEWLAFVPSRAWNPLNAHTFVTYAFVVGNILDWVRVALIFVLASQIVERYLKTSELVLLILGSALLGSVLFLLFRPGEAYIGTGAMAAGYMGAYVACWIPHRIVHGGWARAGAILIITSFALGLLSGLLLQLSIVLTGIAAAACVYFRIQITGRSRREGFVADGIGAPRPPSEETIC